ncbi:hypothetical protein N9B82_04335 [Saprospiraceae bacterium]|nr:hypothetical protein [Saprospiraceae bacterium]
MTVSKITIIVGILSILFYLSCSSSKNMSISMPEKGVFFDKISDYGIFSVKGAKLIPHEELINYRVINALFSDYAEKGRFVYMPAGKKAELQEDGFYKWPVGAMIVKNFGYTSDQLDQSKYMETRLLIKEDLEWKAVSYVWQDDGKDAIISKVGDIKAMKIKHGEMTHEFDYVVPNKNQCRSCHNKNDKIDPLGFKFANLNKNIDVNGVSINQIDYLASKNIITRSNLEAAENTMISYDDETQSIQNRALAYLDVNCGHCHRPEGPGNTSGLFLQYNETRTNHLGFCKGPVAAGKGSGGRSYDIFPGNAEESILYYRMSSEDPSAMMPEIGRSLVHAEGVELIKQWINSIDYDCSQESI